MVKAKSNVSAVAKAKAALAKAEADEKRKKDIAAHKAALAKLTGRKK